MEADWRKTQLHAGEHSTLRLCSKKIATIVQGERQRTLEYTETWDSLHNCSVLCNNYWRIRYAPVTGFSASVYIPLCPDTSVS